MEIAFKVTGDTELGKNQFFVKPLIAFCGFKLDGNVL